MSVWIDIAKMGEEIHHPSIGSRMFTREDAESATEAFSYFAAKGYRFPVLKMHGRPERERDEDVNVYGKMLGMRVESDWLQVSFEFYRKDEKVAWNEGTIREFSGHFLWNWKEPHTGKVWPCVLVETSVVSRGHLMNLRDPVEINDGVMMSAQFAAAIATLPKEEDMPEGAKPEDPAEEEAKFMEGDAPTREEFDELKSMVAAILARLEPEAEEESEGAEMSAQEAVFSATIERQNVRIQELEGLNTVIELNAAGIPKEHHDVLIKAKAFNEALFAASVENLKPRGSVQKEIGTQGESTPVGGEATKEAAFAAADKAGCGKGTGLRPRYLLENYPEVYKEEYK